MTKATRFPAYAGPLKKRPRIAVTARTAACIFRSPSIKTILNGKKYTIFTLKSVQTIT
jgi:hypothetical protein